MKLSEKYAGTPFSQEQVDKIAGMLGINNHFAARCVAAEISGYLFLCEYQESRRKDVPDVKNAKRRLERIAALAGNLARLMEDEPLAVELTKPSMDIHDRSDANGGIDMSRLRAEDRERSAKFIETLRFVSKEAGRTVGNEKLFRRAYWLPPTDQSTRSTLSLMLWPFLFKMWSDAGKKVAKTPHGPLHRFIILIHEAIEAPEPNPSTFRDAVSKWVQDGSRAPFADAPS